MRVVSSKIDFANDLASLSMSINAVRYTAAPRRVNTTVTDSLVGWGITNSTVAIAADAREYLKTLFQGKLKTKHLRAMRYLTISIAKFESKVTRAR